jgi:hypothetical protein
VPEARLLERAPRTPVLFLDRRDHCARGDDFTGKTREDLRPQPAADQILLADQQVDAGDVRADLDDRLPFGVVGDEIGLDDPDRPALDDDQVEVGRLAALERGPVLGERLADVVSPPARDVLAAEPRLDERQVVLAERPELD